MSTGLDQRLDQITLEPAPDAGGVPDAPGSVAAPGVPPADGATGEEKVGEDQGNIGEGNDAAGQPPQGEDSEKTPEQVLEKLRTASQPQEGDSPVIKELRGFLKVRADKLEERLDPDRSGDALSDTDREALDMVHGLFDYDLERDRPTTRGFVDRVVQKDPTLVSQLLLDAISVPVPNTDVPGWTYGHALLQNMGLDPMKFHDLVRFSRGELEMPQYISDGAVPDHVPVEYAEAYKQLNPVTRMDVDLYLRSEDPAQKAAALTTLQDKHGNIQRARADAQRAQQEGAVFDAAVQQDVGAQVEQTYDNLLDTVGKNKAFVDVKVHTDPNVDNFVKDTILNGVAALGDANSVVAKRAVESFKRMGVAVDQAKVNGLLKSIQRDTEIAVRAERKAKAMGLTVSPQAEEARARVSKNVGDAISMANRIAGEALGKYSPAAVKQVTKGGAEPNLGAGGGQGGGQPQGQSRPEGVLSPADLDAMILNTSKTLREGVS